MNLEEYRFFREAGDRHRDENDLERAYSCYISAANSVKNSRCIANREAQANALALAGEILDEMLRSDEADCLRNEALAIFESLQVRNKLADRKAYARACLIRLQKLCLKEADQAAVEEAYAIACTACHGDYDALCVAHCSICEWARITMKFDLLIVYCSRAVGEAERAFGTGTAKGQGMALGLYSNCVDSLIFAEHVREAGKLFSRFEELCDAAKPETKGNPMVKRISGKWRTKLRRYFEMEVCVNGKA